MANMRIIGILVLVIGLCQSLQAQKSDGSGESSQLLVYVPNAFSPNFDGTNDVFKPVISGPELEFYELIVLDRLGKEVFHSSDPNEVWNGSINGGDYLSSPNLFVYLMKVKSVESIETETFQGHVVMIR